MNDKRLEKVIRYGVKKINDNKELLKFFKEKIGEEKRTSIFKIITNTGDIETGGFAYDGDKFVYVENESEIGTPTVVFKTTDDVVWSLILGKLELESAVYLGEVQVEGAYWLRDVALFTRAFKEFNDVFTKMY